MKEVLVLFSGGKDSLLSTIRYLDNGYKVYLITYSNSLDIGFKNVKITINKLIKKYGHDKVIFLGNKNISPIFRNFIYPFYNYEFNYILKKYGNITISQFNCLACRLSMYVASIIVCKQKNINEVIDGARNCQLFVIEQEKMLNEFTSFFKEYNLDIIYPLRYMEDDWDLKNELLIRGFIPKTIEPQCLLGCPLNKKASEELILSIYNVYKLYLEEKAKKIINDYSNIKICEEFI